MSVLVKGMTMPTSCMLCSFCVEEADPANGEMCMVTGSLMPPCTRVRLDNCPLVPVPPHGDLIDRDALYDVVKKRTRNWNGGWSDIECVMTGNDIKNAPTVIEAEEET